MLENLKKWNFWLVGGLLLITTIIVVSLILLISKVNPLSFWNIIFIQPLSNLVSFSDLIETFCVLLLAGLAVAITFKYRIYNLGVSGQMMFSAIVTYVLAVAIAKSGGHTQWITPFLMLIAIMIGSLVGLTVAVLKAYFKVHETISTILFNFIAWEGYKGIMTSKAYESLEIPTDITNLRFSLISGPFSITNLFSVAIIIALLVFIIVVIMFNNRTLGFKLNAIAKNPIAAKQARLNPQFQGLIILPISGAISGIAGYLYFLGINHHLPELSGPIQEGFYGIVVAAMAGYAPLFVLTSTFFVSLFVSPIEHNNFIYLKNPEMALIILGVTVYLMGIYPFIWHYLEHSIFIKEQWQQFKKKVLRQKISEEVVVAPNEIEVIHLQIGNKKPFKKKPTLLKDKIMCKKEKDK